MKNGIHNCCCIGKKVYYKYFLHTLILYDFLKTLIETSHHITSLETSGCLSFHYIANFWFFFFVKWSLTKYHYTVKVKVKVMRTSQSSNRKYSPDAPPQGSTPRKIGRGCAAQFPKPLPQVWPKSAIFPTLFMAWPLNQNPVSELCYN